MKRYIVVIIVSILVLIAASAEAQQRTAGPSPQAQQDQQRLVEQIVALRARAAGAQAAEQQRGGGGRGAPAGADPAGAYADTVKRFFWTTGSNSLGLPDGAWWTNAALVTRLGLTDDQKSKLEKAFENRRQTLTTDTEALNKEEAQLTKLLQADSLDRNAIFTEIDRVVQARGELERANANMTLEMREILTKAQWMQLQSQPRWTGGDVSAIRLRGAASAGQGERSGGGRGQRQQ